MRYVNKAISLAIIASLMGTQLAFAQTVQPQQGYNVVPPSYNQNEQLPDLGNPPSYYPTSGTQLKGQVSTIPSGTAFGIALNSTISSSSSQLGEIFTASITEPIVVNGGEIIPAGSEAIGQITYVEGAGRAGKNAAMAVKFTSIKLPNGQKVPIMAKIATTDNSGQLKGGSLKSQIAKSVAGATLITAGGTLTGLTIGGLLGGISTGASTVLGLTTAGFGSIVWVVGRKGKEVTVQSGTRMLVQLEQPVTVGRE